MKKISILVLSVFALSEMSAQTAPPYSQDFSIFPPSGWTMGYSYSPNVGTGPESTNTTFWEKKPFLNDTAHNDSSISVNLYSTNISHWAITNVIDLSGSQTYKVSFEYASGGGPFSNPSGPAAQVECDDVFKFLISSDGGTTWEELKSVVSPNTNIPNAATTVTLDLTNYHSANTKFAFFASDGSVYNWQADYTLYVDNFKVEAASLATSESAISATKLYPNPTTGVVFVKSSKMVNTINIYNSNGQLISSGQTMDLTKKPSGIYVAKITYADGSSSTEKIIKK